MRAEHKKISAYRYINARMRTAVIKMRADCKQEYIADDNKVLCSTIELQDFKIFYLRSGSSSKRYNSICFEIR